MVKRVSHLEWREIKADCEHSSILQLARNYDDDDYNGFTTKDALRNQNMATKIVKCS